MIEKKPQYVKSRLNHPVTIAYHGRSLIIPPRGKVKIKDSTLLGALPKGVQLI